ncbi:SDR family NAD(P)-dependent oxidoreductase [Falsigemmobacter faecalis]|uniref:Glucose 1-dehydrogenase n=1 Tax=Falsigemmobacter faecalis TaxID=2488730 RepID=A0A3P3DCG1_9RHOB|nr:glucose 1-dehydrogenase [Falsigemmobacter faecalis]RRH71514.1 glucose 1-dehydrogenase [Falsigemmobacter faecalis]
MSDWLGLAGKTVAVTGALGGIGRAITRAFLEAGVNVLLIDRKPADETEAMAEFAGKPARFAAADVSDKASLEAAFALGREAFGAIDLLVNNAAMSNPAPLRELSMEAFERQMQVNVGGYLLCAQVYLAQRPEGGGSIVNIASIAGRNAQLNSGGYACGKAAILMLSQQMALEWGPEGLRVNSVSPGLFVTPLTKHFYEDPADRQRREEVVPLRRVGDPKDLADAVVYLSSSRAAYVNGAEIIVDGGFSQTLMSHIPRPYHKR